MKLITGGSGFLGKEFLKKIDNYFSLDRNKGHDILAHGLGLNGIDKGTITEIWHFAGSVNLNGKDVYRVNVEGIENLISFAYQCRKLKRFVHISTAYVCGDRKGDVFADELDLGQGFKNDYEKSKLIAEQRIIDSGLPYIVVRPSVVYCLNQINLIPWQGIAMVGGNIRIVGNENASLNIIKLEDAVDLILEHGNGDIGTRQHAVSPQNTSMGELRDMICHKLKVSDIEYVGECVDTPNRYEKAYDRITKAFQPYMLIDDPVFR
ncbi:MAG: SDR family oxidoreductase [Candidatus Woesearchaeota archaeon]